jgi:hypothetical protein
MQDWPQWWDYEVALSPHLLDRMVDRDFSEADLRAMLGDAGGHRPSATAGRFVIATRYAGWPWEVVVEPDELERKLIVVTAYRVE